MRSLAKRLHACVFRDVTGGPDMVLGMDWLTKLGNIEANFGELCLKWKLGGQKYSIQGDPALFTSWKTMLKALTDDGVGF
ncbi:hypothetical protein KIW84_060872 [Lathyrus oleraceus]|uniref:Uncharacterized protein n=1 Tax=Pisum sativum TaxID=3888 RepID=A0A9D4W0V0_PEA|nr:hypothetical protein KIW84_060872 [Pisum sativum]